MRLPGWLIVVLIAIIILAAAGAAVVTVSWLGPIRGGPQLAASKVMVGEAVPSGPLHKAGLFTVNLASDRTNHNFLRASVVLEVDERKTLQRLNEREPAVRDAIIGVLREFTASQLREPGGMETLKERLRLAIGDLLGEGDVHRVYFTDFIIQ